MFFRISFVAIFLLGFLFSLFGHLKENMIIEAAYGR